MAAANPITEERDRVESWRREELERAGYPPDAAAKLAARDDVDLRRAISLLEHGCTPELALRILL
jgi:hypothetical protein